MKLGGRISRIALASTAVEADAVILCCFVKHGLSALLSCGEVQQCSLDALPSELVQVVAEEALLAVVVINVPYVLFILAVLHELVRLQVL